MAFKILTQEEISVLREPERKAYLQAYQEYQERKAFVDRLEQLDNVQMPKPAIRKQRIRKIGSPEFRNIKVEAFTAETKAGVEILNATDRVKRSVESRTRFVRPGKFTAKVPEIKTAVADDIRIEESDPFIVKAVAPVQTNAPAAVSYEEAEFKTEVPLQKMIAAPQTGDVTIEAYELGSISEELRDAAGITAPATKFTAPTEDEMFRVQVETQPEVVAPDVKPAEIGPYVVSDMPALSDTTDRISADSVSSAAEKLGEQTVVLGIIESPDVVLPQIGDVKIEEYHAAGIPVIDVAANTAEAIAAMKFADNPEKPLYQVTVENQPEIAAPAIGDVAIDSYEVNGVAGVHIATGAVPAPVDAIFETTVPEIAVAAPKIDEITVPAAGAVSVAAVPVAKAADVNIAESDFEVTGCDCVVAAAPTVDYQAAPAVRVEACSVIIPEFDDSVTKTIIDAMKPSDTLQNAMSQVTATIARAQAGRGDKIDYDAVASRIRIGTEAANPGISDVPTAAEIHFTKPTQQLDEITVPSIFTPSLDVNAAMETILAKLR